MTYMRLHSATGSGMSGDIEKLAVLCGCPVSDLWELPARDLAAATAAMKFDQVSDVPNREVDGKPFRDFNSLTVGEYLDLEDRQGADWFPFQLRVMYTDKEYDYEVALAESGALKSQPAGPYIPALNAYQRWRRWFQENYSGLMSHAGEEIPIKDETPEEKMIREAAAKEEAEQSRKFSSLYLLGRLAGFDPLKYDAAAKLNCIFAFNHLSMMKELKLNE